MKRILTEDDNFSTTIADTLSDTAKSSLQKAKVHGNSAMDKGTEVARSLGNSTAAKYVQNNPVKTVGFALLGGIAIYWLLKKSKKKEDVKS